MDAENESSHSEQQAQRAEETPPAADSVAPLGGLYCPLCGGQVTQRWRGVSTFVAVTFCISLFLTPVVFCACTAGAGPAFFIPFVVCGGIAVLSFWAMPIAVAIAVVVQPRCRSCGHWLQTGSDGLQRPSAASFPRSPAVIGSVILLVILAVSLLWLRTAPGLETSVMGVRLYLWVVLAGFAFGLGLLTQAVVWRSCRARMAGTGRKGGVLLLATLVVGVGWLALTACDYYYLCRTYDPVKRAPQVLDRAGLAALPPSARGVKVYSWAFMLSGQFVVRFAAEPNDIERFLAASPSLEGLTCRTYSSKRMRLPGERYSGRFDRRDGSKHDYFDPQRFVPPWYQREIRGRGRAYEISWYDGKYEGELLVDDERDVVYVDISRF